ncbi:MAG TPA: AAA family ATPase [Patescibacteria group bacterium]|nr:AAA family ATPase [Patescibacteria group bacterium]
MKHTRLTAISMPLEEAARIGEAIRALIDQLGSIFPEREHLLQQILYALLTKEHVLVFGPHGTGKSDLLHTLFESFEGARVFSIALSKFMSEANIIGIPDPSLMREKGEVRYRRDGGILDADFVELDELFDSNWPLLRVLLGILNERSFKRGRQVEDANLHTAVACTNGAPDQEVKRQPELAAVIDRFLFHCKVGYLKDAGNRCRMYLKYLGGAQPTAKVTLKDLKALSDVVTEANQITDEFIVQVHDRIVTAYSEKAKVVVSDRRKCKLLQLVEANALLYGRYEIDIEDLAAVKWGLCLGGDDAQHKIFDEEAAKIIAEAKKTRPQSVDEVQAKLLEEYEGKLPSVPAQCPPDQLVEICRQMTALAKSVEDVRPQLPSTLERKKKLLGAIGGRKDAVLQRIQGA